MPTYIRLTDYKSSEEKEKGFFDPKNRYEAKQEDFEKIPGSPIAYWVSDRVKEIFEKGIKLGKIANPRIGMATGNNDLFMRQWQEVEFKRVGLNIRNIRKSIESNKKWFPYNKGGDFKRWYGNQEYIVNWENNGELIRTYTNEKGKVRSHNYNDDFIFKESLSWSFLSSNSFGIRYTQPGFLFDNTGSSMFLYDNHNTTYLLSFLSSKVAYNFLKLLNPTMSFQPGNLSNLPIIFPKDNSIKQKIDQLTQQNIDISKKEWDSRETSWDFKINPLIDFSKELRAKGKELTLKDAYNRYCEYWREKFFTLHKNEEELNRLFIEIYELEDELTPEVDLKDITILKNEAKIVDGELEFQSDEIIKQFISYAVGVMFGRYSLDHNGLHIANMDESVEEVNSKFNIQNSTFEIDEDNIIPVLEDEYFDDDIVNRFTQFVKAVFGKEHLRENLEFIEDALGMSVRKYFIKGFYEDHIKRYKKRPIYWMVSSPKKSFMSLFYMHRYKSDIFAKIQNDYLREYITKLESSKELAQREAHDSTNSPAQRKKANKVVENINKKLDEIIKFDREVLTSFAQNRVEIDLDDGVKVNYCKFKEILYPISGLCKK